MIEALLSISLMGLLGTGAIALFLSATRLSLKASAPNDFRTGSSQCLTVCDRANTRSAVFFTAE